MPELNYFFIPHQRSHLPIQETCQTTSRPSLILQPPSCHSFHKPELSFAFPDSPETPETPKYYEQS